jgi:hypothetical protein
MPALRERNGFIEVPISINQALELERGKYLSPIRLRKVEIRDDR